MMKPSSKNLILINANIITLDPLSPHASWVAIENDKIVTTGYGKDWENLRHKNSGIIDCSRKTVIPIFSVTGCYDFIILDSNPGSMRGKIKS